MWIKIDPKIIEQSRRSNERVKFIVTFIGFFVISYFYKPELYENIQRLYEGNLKGFAIIIFSLTAMGFGLSYFMAKKVNLSGSTNYLCFDCDHKFINEKHGCPKCNSKNIEDMNNLEWKEDKA